ncbi:2-C-methyl-D-erythritol 2,4-cyclodiphosphate synthase [bacterium BMS3Abin02]|nr:2-C-methyl-D-erythritol 2,4-cyclodiphosphate synthase [bacterium BMS3Abin02]GBE22999.1 2-C-methyl-D-erythritol 2,4-cyclodiphosphate synthase [bacterium BMS3Bbin01]
MSTIGWGFDAHRFGGEAPVLLAGVVVDARRGLVGTSDADVVAHAVADALLGATALGDLGTFFPSGDTRWQGVDSMELLESVVSRCRAAGLIVDHVDVTVIAETVRISPVREEIRRRLAGALKIDQTAVSVKATSTDGMGFTGRDEGIAAAAVVIGELASVI